MYLKVDSAYPEDHGTGRCRLDPTTMQQLRLVPGDLVYLEGQRKTVAKVWRMQSRDWGHEKIRIDNFIRLNAGVSIGDSILIRPVEDDVEAQRVLIAPPEDLTRQMPINYNQASLKLIGFPAVKNDTIPIVSGLPFMQQQLVAFKVVDIEPAEAVIITADTEIEFSDKPAEGFEGVRKISYEDIGGLKGELQNVRETIELPMRHPELFRKLGIEPPKGVLLYGPPGTGKTLIAKAVANESGAHFISIAGPEVISKYYGESEQRLREIFEEAEENAPAIIFIDELDSITPKREDVTGEVERRVVAQLLTMMDGLEERGQVLVIGATNRLDAIDQALRRPGRFDREIEIGVPDEHDRLEILKIHTRGMPLEGEVRLIRERKEEEGAEEEKGEEISQRLSAVEDEIKGNQERLLAFLASKTHGFVGADIQALAREAAMRSLRRYLPQIDLDNDEIPEEIMESLEVTSRDFRDALRDVSPSAMREVLIEVPNIKWADIGGLDQEKEEVREAVEYPLTQPERFENLGIEPPHGVLLYGPPGTGKTLIAKAVATESGANFIPVRGPQLLSKWVGESERAVREIFKKARQVAPSIIFFDELDAIAPARGGGSDSHVIESVVNQILTEFDGIDETRGVVIVAATNRPDIIDPALLRAGRFDRLVAINEPQEAGRREILAIHTRYIPLEGSAMETLVEETKEFDEAGLDSLFEGLAKERAGKEGPSRITVEELLAWRVDERSITGDLLSRSRRRRLLRSLLDTHAFILDDPVREGILSDIASRTSSYVGSDLDLLCREAAMISMRSGRDFVTMEDFEQALNKVRPMMNERVREQYSRIQQYFKGGLPSQMQVNLPEYQ